MNRWRLLLIVASAAAALTVGLTAQAHPDPPSLQALLDQALSAIS